MALEIKLSTAFGVDATYHKLVELQYDFRSEKGTATLASFKDKSTRIAEKSPLTNCAIQIESIDNLSPDNIYKAIKQNEIFADAKDV